MVQPEGTVTTGCDVNGYPDSVSDWRGDTIAMTNDADGRMLTVERSNGVDTAYGYDGVFDNGNKRTALAIAEDSFDRSGAASPGRDAISDIVNQVGRGDLRTVEDIAKALGG